MICERIEIEAAAAHVWGIMADLERWPEWAPSFRRVARIGGPTGTGACYRVEQPRLPPARMVVTHWRPGEGFTWASRGALLGAVGDHVIESLGAHRCRVRLELRFEGLAAPVAERLLGRLTRDYVASEAAGLKAAAEGRASRGTASPAAAS